jgi:hypothetical protein
MFVFYNTSTDAQNAVKIINAFTFLYRQMIVSVQAKIMCKTFEPFYTVEKKYYPIREFIGRTMICNRRVQAKSLVNFLVRKKYSEVTEEDNLVIGVDTRCNFKKTRDFSNPVILQMVCEDRCVLFKLHCICKDGTLPEPLRLLLENPCIKKVGLLLKNDMEIIQSIYGVITMNIEDIGSMKLYDRTCPRDLYSLMSIFLGYRIEKNVDLYENWDALYLSQSLVKRASELAWAQRELYLQMSVLEENLFSFNMEVNTIQLNY